MVDWLVWIISGIIGGIIGLVIGSIITILILRYKKYKMELLTQPGVW